MLHGYGLLSRKFGLFRGELPVPMEHVAQAKNAHTHAEPHCTAHWGEAQICATSGYQWFSMGMGIFGLRDVLHGYRQFSPEQTKCSR